jgi:hypothetical protein
MQVTTQGDRLIKKRFGLFDHTTGVSMFFA